MIIIFLQVPATQLYLVYNVANNPKGQINLNEVKEKALLYCLMLSWKLLGSAVLLPVKRSFSGKG